MIACQAEHADKFLGLISKDFILRFKEELKEVFGYERFDWDDEDIWINLGSTCGWGNAFNKTCWYLDVPDLKQYYDALDWFDSDNFDGDVSDLAVKYGVIRPMTIVNNDERAVW